MVAQPEMTDHTAFIRANTAIASPSLVPEIRLHLAGEVTPLWHATEASLAQNQLPPPYWAFAWPGGQALARLVLDRPETVRGKRVLDFGAGGGVAAIAASRAGAARAAAAEIDPFAVAAIALNAALNGVQIAVESRDFLAFYGDFSDRSGAQNAIFQAEYDVILIGDMCYERPLAERLMAWLTVAAARGAEILLGDPGRAHLPKDGLEFVTTYTVPTSLDLEDRPVRETKVWRLRPA
jgi:predicted nicotinamide N-methyase